MINKTALLKEMVVLADELDNRGMLKEAELVDQIMTKVAAGMYTGTFLGKPSAPVQDNEMQAFYKAQTAAGKTPKDAFEATWAKYRFTQYYPTLLAFKKQMGF